jgi:hypothetical protein
MVRRAVEGSSCLGWATDDADDHVENGVHCTIMA